MSVERSRFPVPAVSTPVILGGLAFLSIISISTYMIVHPGVPAVPIPSAKVHWGAISPYISATGTVGNHQTVDISSSVGGQIVRWLVQEGSTVRASQPLAYFSNYATNEKILQNLDKRLQQLRAIEQDAAAMNQLDAKRSGSESAIIQDRAAVTLAYDQWQAARLMETAVRRQGKIVHHVPVATQTAAHEEIAKAQTTVALDRALLQQTETKWRSDRAVVSSADTLAIDHAAVQVAQRQLSSAQQLALAAQQQVKAVTHDGQQSKAAAVQAAKQAVDQANAQVKVDQAAVVQALQKLQGDEAPQATPGTLQQDQANINVLEQQLSAAQTALANDQTPQATPATLNQDQANINVLEQQVAAAQEKLAADAGPQATQATLQQDQANINVLQQQLTAAQNKLTLDQSPQASASVVQQDQSSISVLQQELTGAKAQLSADTANNASSSILQSDQTNISVLQQELTNAQNKLALDQAPQASTAVIQQDQASIGVLKQQLSQAQAQLKLDQTQTASSSTVAQDQANLNVLQQQLSAAQNQLKIDQTQVAAPGVIQQAQANVNVLQQQLAAAQNQLQLDKTQTAPSSVIQEDVAALNLAQAQEKGAQTLAADDEAAYQQALASTNQASLASAQSALAQAAGAVSVDNAALAQAKVKLQADQQNKQPQALLNEDRSAVLVAQDQLQTARKLAADAAQSALSTLHPTQAQLITAQINMDQAAGTATVDWATWKEAQAKLQTDQAPAGKRLLLSAEQSVLQAKEAVDQAKLNVINAQVALYHSELRAPIAGEVVAIQVPAGSRIYAQQSAVTLFPAHQRPQIVMAIGPSEVDQVHAGERVTFRSSGFPGLYKGRVQFVSPVPTSQTQGGGFQYPVYVNVTALPSGVTSGMLVNARVYTPSLTHVLVVPAQAVMVHKGQIGVYVRRANRQYVFQAVTIGASDNRFAQVIGLKKATVVALRRP